MRATLATGLVFFLACGGKKDGGGDDGNAPDACKGLECQVVNCSQMSLPPTTLSGIVFAPNGTLPLNGVNVYVPRDPLPPFTEGVQCDRCSTTLPGSAIAQTVSLADGSFHLENVPAGANIPLVITTGKWRRVVTISNVSQCSDNAVAGSDTSLPRKTSATDSLPKIALSTGSADSLECLVRKLGVDDSEVTNGTGTGRVNFFHGNGRPSITGSGNLSESKDALWKSFDTLKPYDIVFLSCEGAQNDNTKPQAALNAIEQYADAGGRVFASHWHNIWVGGNFEAGNGNTVVAKWKNVATWNPNDNGSPGSPITIDEVSNPKGALFADWMLNVMGSTTRDQILQTSGTERRTALTLDTTKAERWVQTQTAAPNPAVGGPQMFQFTSPIDVSLDQRCGKVVFTDMHVSGDGDANGTYPGTCGDLTTPLSAQEKALAFMFFDIAGCVGGLF